MKIVMEHINEVKRESKNVLSTVGVGKESHIIETITRLIVNADGYSNPGLEYVTDSEYRKDYVWMAEVFGISPKDVCIVSDFGEDEEYVDDTVLQILNIIKDDRDSKTRSYHRSVPDHNEDETTEIVANRYAAVIKTTHDTPGSRHGSVDIEYVMFVNPNYIKV